MTLFFVMLANRKDSLKIVPIWTCFMLSCEHYATSFLPCRTSDGEPGHSYHLTLVNTASSGSANVSVGVYVTQCKYYNVSQDVWDTAGCVPSEYSTIKRSLCHCNHLTLYGTSVLISAAELDFNAVSIFQFHIGPVAVTLDTM